MEKNSAAIPKSFLPFNFNTLLDFLSKKAEREKLHKEIEE